MSSCQRWHSFFLSFFKLILGVMQLETHLICSERFLLFLLTTAHQLGWVFWYLIAAPWCCWTLPPPSPSLPNSCLLNCLAHPSPGQRVGAMNRWLATSAGEIANKTELCVMALIKARREWTLGGFQFHEGILDIQQYRHGYGQTWNLNWSCFIWIIILDTNKCRPACTLYGYRETWLGHL